MKKFEIGDKIRREIIIDGRSYITLANVILVSNYYYIIEMDKGRYPLKNDSSIIEHWEKVTRNKFDISKLEIELS